MKVLVVDDDRVLADVIAFTFRREGFQVIQAFDGETALARWREAQPNLVVLDVNLPKLDGFAVCRRIRAQSDTPILLLTVRDQEDDIIHGLGIGADDYITKPFSPRQLVARAQAVLRRVGARPAPAIRQAGALSLDLSRREIQIQDGHIVPLTPLECQLLDYLMANAGQVLTYEAIISEIWGPMGGDRDMLRQLVRRLRQKIVQASPATPELAAGADQVMADQPLAVLIETVPGLGYGLTVLSSPP